MSSMLAESLFQLFAVTVVMVICFFRLQHICVVLIYEINESVDCNNVLTIPTVVCRDALPESAEP